MKAHIQTQFPPKILFYAIKPGSEKERALGRSLPGGRDSLGGGSGWPAGRPVGVAGRTGRLFPFFGAVGKRTARSGSHGVLWAGRKKGSAAIGENGRGAAAGRIESDDDASQPALAFRRAAGRAGKRASGVAPEIGKLGGVVNACRNLISEEMPKGRGFLLSPFCYEF